MELQAGVVSMERFLQLVPCDSSFPPGGASKAGSEVDHKTQSSEAESRPPQQSDAPGMSSAGTCQE